MPTSITPAARPTDDEIEYANCGACLYIEEEPSSSMTCPVRWADIGRWWSGWYKQPQHPGVTRFTCLQNAIQRWEHENK